MMLVSGGCGTVLKTFKWHMFLISMSIAVNHSFASGASSMSWIVRGSGVDRVGMNASEGSSKAPGASNAPAVSV